MTIGDMVLDIYFENFLLKSIEDLRQCGVNEPLAILCSKDMWYRFLGGGEEAYGVDIIASDIVGSGKIYVMTKSEAQNAIAETVKWVSTKT